MKLEAQTQENLTEDLVRQISKKNNEPTWLLKKRLEAFENFSQLEFGSFVYGLGIRIDTSSLDLESINPIESLGNQPLKTEKSQNIIASDLHEAISTYEDIIKKHLMTTGETDKLSALHKAFWTRGLFVHVPKETEATLKYDSFLDKTLLENILIIVEPFSKLNIMDISKGRGDFRSQYLEIFAKDSSTVNFTGIQEYKENTFNLSDRTAVMENNSTINWIVSDIGGSVTRSNVTTILQGEGSSVKNIGLFLSGGNQQSDFMVTAIHKGRNTTSDMLTKGALTGKSKAVYRGYVKIKETAPKSSGYQRADILLLSPDAEADPIPNLEIDNNDINKCTHGATVGQIEKDKLFYMMSRGLSKIDATKQIVRGLFEPAMKRIHTDSVRRDMEEILEKRLKDYESEN